jgi:hypothetical protein
MTELETTHAENSVWIVDTGLFIACGRQHND